jgi:colanic acid biosynthesis glycosyl transferase WcaI
MKIAVLCPHFEPDTAPTGEVITRIVHELAARGHELHVITALPWYRDHRIEAGWTGKLVRREQVSWGSVTRVHPFPQADKGSIPKRALSFAGFTALSAVVGAAGKRVDVVLSMSPPLTLGLAGDLMALCRRAPLVFNIQDVFPDVAVELGALRNDRVISFFQALERWCYRRSDAVTVLSDDLAANLRAKVARQPGGPEKIKVIPNFVDSVAVRPLDRMTPYRAELGIGDEVVVMYAGNVGLSQSLDLVLDAAGDFQRDASNVVFLINGSGSGRAHLESEVAARRLANVRFGDFQPRDRLAEVLATGDIHVVPLKAGLARSSVPSKSYSILAAGRPMLASVDAGTEIDRMTKAAGAGLCVAPDDPAAFSAALRDLVAAPLVCQRMGASGRAWVEKWASPAGVAEQYEALFADVHEHWLHQHPRSARRRSG